MSAHVEPEEDREDGPDGAEVSESVTESVIQVDIYGCKVRIVPAETGDPRPKSWTEVAMAVNLKLMAIAVNLIAVVNDILEGSRKLIRGLTKPPRRAARRVGRSHAKADRAEAIAQEKAEAQPPLPSAAADAADRIEALVLRKQAEGFTAQFVDMGDGRLAMVFVKPEERSIAGLLIRKALPPSGRVEGETIATPETPPAASAERPT